MDPGSAVGLAASILQIINTTAQIIQYLKDVREAPEERAQIQREADSLLGLLKSLRDRVEHANQKDPWYVQICSLEGQGGPLDQYQSAMIALAKKLKPESGVKKLEKRLLWTFDKKQIKATLVLIERLKSLISLALQGDHFELSLAVKIETHEVKDYISIISKSLGNVVESVAELKLGQQQAAKWYSDEEQQKVLEWLSPLNFASKQVDTFERHQPDTGEWLFEEEMFKAWLAGEKNALWCSGIPGAGKTILTSLVVNHLECSYPFQSKAVAILYLSYGDQEEQSAKNLIGSLVRQVAHGKRTLSDEVIGLYRDHAFKASRPTISELSNLLHSEITGLSEVFILVDAMDECSNNNYTREDLLTTLQSLLEMPNVRLLITSRPVASIDAHLQGMTYLEIRAADEDVRKYIENRIPKERRLIPYIRGDHAFQVSIIDTIIAKAQGMFLMAQLHLGSLAKKINKRDVRLALQRLPEKLDDTYADAITRISSQDEDDVQLAKRTLMWISCAKRPLRIIELRHALAIEPGAKELDPESLPDEDVIVDVCSGLVTIDRESETIRLVHYTTQDYLVRVRAELFATAEIDITFCCLTYLLFSTSVQISELEESENPAAELKAAYPFWSYAARFWGSHAHENAQYDARTQHLVFQLLEPNNKALGLIRSEPLRDHWIYRYGPYDVPGIHTAACFDLTGLGDTLLDRGILVDAKDNRDSLTALHCAAIWGHVATLRLLLDRGASIDMPDIRGYTAFMMAAEEGHKDSVQFLLEKGADVNGQHCYRGTALYEAAARGHQSIVELLLNKGADVNRQNLHGWTALYEAAARGHQSIVELLLAKGADIHIRDGIGRTALCIAAREGYQTIVELLLAKCADIDIRDRIGETAVYVAAQGGHQKIVELLLAKGANIDGRDYNGKAALYIAAQRGHQSIVELLLEKGADVNGQDHNGETALYVAAQGGHQRIMQLLLEKGADVDSRDRIGNTALYIAASEGHQSIVELLLKEGADVNGQDHDGETALYIAAEGGHQRIVEILLEKGADFDVRDHRGNATLYIAAQSGHQRFVELLLEKGADVNGQDHDGETALYIAAEGGHQRIVEILLEKGADVNARDPLEDPVLHELALRGDYSMLEILLRYGADVDARRQYDGATALHEAADWGRKSIVQLLLDAGADLKATMSYEDRQLTASDIAKENCYMDVFELLQKAREQRKTLPIRNLAQSQNLVGESNSPAD